MSLFVWRGHTQMALYISAMLLDAIFHLTYRRAFERARGNRVLMVSGSDEHGTPITVSAEQNGISPQDVVDKYHAINSKALLDLGRSWEQMLIHAAFNTAVHCLIVHPMHAISRWFRKIFRTYECWTV